MKKLLLTAISLLTITIQISFGANPADLTADHRADPGPFYKAAYEQNSQFLFANIPYDRSGNVSVLSWRGNESRFVRMIIAKKLAAWLDGAIESNFTPGQIDQFLALDANWKIAGLGIIAPLKGKKDEKSIGPRVSIRGFSLYLTASLADRSQNLYGLSYGAIKGFKTDLAYGSKTLFFRLNRAINTDFGLFIPEFRSKFTKENRVLGFGIGFVPKE